MKIHAHMAIANLIGLSLAAVAYLLSHSSCMGLPEWATPVLLTVQLMLNAVAPAIITRKDSA